MRTHCERARIHTHADTIEEMGFYCGAAVPVTTVPNNRHSASCKRTVNAGAGAGAKGCQLYREKKHMRVIYRVKMVHDVHMLVAGATCA